MRAVSQLLANISWKIMFHSEPNHKINALTYCRHSIFHSMTFSRGRTYHIEYYLIERSKVNLMMWPII